MNNKLNTLNLTDKQTEAILARIKSETEYSPYYDGSIALYDGNVEDSTDYNLGYDSGSYYVANTSTDEKFDNIEEAVDYLIEQLNFFPKGEA